MITATSRRASAAAFTLTELLIVLVVLALLVTLAAPSLFHQTMGSKLTTTGELILNKLSEAQQEAIASNSEVEVRFFEHMEKMGEEKMVPRLRSMQLFTLGASDDADASAFITVESVVHFEDGVVISYKSKLSSLLEAGFKRNVDTSGNGERYLSLRFQPDGSTNLAEGSPWFLTFVRVETEDVEEVPANFYTLQVDPVTGRVRSFRP